MLSERKPLGVDLCNIDPVGLYNETQKNDALKQRLTRFGQIFRSLEGLKQFVVPYYNLNIEKIHAFKDAIFYNELVQIQVFSEFINHLNNQTQDLPNINKILQSRNNQRLNKIRNSIAHFDWTFNDGKITFKDNNYERTEEYYEISEFSSLISIIAIFMTNNIEHID